MKTKRNVNWKVVIYSLIALGFLALGFFVNGYFILGAVVFMILNQKEIMGKKKESKN